MPSARRTATPRTKNPLKWMMPSAQAVFGTISSALLVRLVDNAWGYLIDSKLPWLRPAVDTVQMRSSFEVCSHLAHSAIPGYRFAPPAQNYSDVSRGTRHLVSDLVVGRVVAMLFDLLLSKLDRLLAHQHVDTSREAPNPPQLGSSKEAASAKDNVAIQVNVSISQGGTSHQQTEIHQGTAGALVATGLPRKEATRARLTG